MHESLVKYLAGLLDADGSLSFSFYADPKRPGQNFVRLALRLTASDVVDKKGFVASLPETTGMGTVSRYGPNQKFAVWNVSKRSDLEKLLPRIIKHMVIKGKHWDWILNEWRSIRGLSYGERKISDEERAKWTAESKRSRVERVGPVKPKNHPTWAWLAGYLDGDGCYTFRQNPGTRDGRTYMQWSIHVSAVAHKNDIHVLEFLQKAFGGYMVGQGQSDNVMVWRRSLGAANSNFALQFLPNVVKHSRLKRHKIEQMIHHHRQRLSVSGATA